MSCLSGCYILFENIHSHGVIKVSFDRHFYVQTFFLPNWKFVTLFVICRCLLILLESSRENRKSEIKLHCILTFLQTFLTQADILHASLIYSRRFLIYTSPYTFILVFLVVYFHKYFSFLMVFSLYCNNNPVHFANSDFILISSISSPK